MSGLREDARKEIGQRAATSDHPVAPGSAEYFLSQCRQEIEFSTQIVEELREKLRSVCRPEAETADKPGPEASAPQSSLADAFAHMEAQTARNNEALRGLLHRLDLP